MKNILLIGDYKDNGGPTNVNRELINNSNKKIKCIFNDNKYLRFIETLFKIILFDVIVISGYSNKSIFYTDFCHFLKKKVVYLMHGCIKYENEINILGLSDNYVESEIKFLNKVDLILCTSELYSNWVKNFYPQIISKISFLNNGIPFIGEIKPNKKKKKNEYNIILIGGNRNIKNNLIVCKAIKELVNEGLKINLKLFGRKYKNNEIIDDNNVIYKGMVSREELMTELKNSDIYICNSLVESFGLSVIDALIAGCDILISKNVGASSIFKIDDNFVINDCKNLDEIKEKIRYILKNSNNRKIIKSIKKNTSYKSASEKLIHICNNL